MQLICGRYANLLDDRYNLIGQNSRPAETWDRFLLYFKTRLRPLFLLYFRTEEVSFLKLFSRCFLRALVLTNKLKLNPNWWSKSFHAVFRSKILDLLSYICWLSCPCWAFCSRCKILLSRLSFGPLQLARCMGLRKGKWHCSLAFLHRVCRLGHFQMEIDALFGENYLRVFNFMWKQIC